MFEPVTPRLDINALEKLYPDDDVNENVTGSPTS